MRNHGLKLGALALVCAGLPASAQAPADNALPTPGFYYIQLNSANPQATIDEYLKIVPNDTRVTIAGMDGFKTTNNVNFLVNKVSKAPPAAIQDKITPESPQTAFWHFVFPVKSLPDAATQWEKSIPNFKSRLLTLYVDSKGATVEPGGETLAGFLTEREQADARAKGVKPTPLSYITWVGPDGAIIENAGFGQVGGLQIYGMFEDQPYCAVLWYQKHLNTVPAKIGANAPDTTRTEANCTVTLGTEPSYPSTYKRGHMRSPPAMGVTIGGVVLRWYMNQEKTPLAPQRGGVVDHIGLSVANLDPWIAKLRGENVKFLKGPAPYMVGNMRAVMIEGPSHEAIELIEVKS